MKHLSLIRRDIERDLSIVDPLGQLYIAYPGFAVKICLSVAGDDDPLVG